MSTVVIPSHLDVCFGISLLTRRFELSPRGLTSTGHTNLLCVWSYAHAIVASIASAAIHSPHRHDHMQLASRHLLCRPSTSPMSMALASLPVPTETDADAWLQKNVC
jgi:hypothetical protein